MNELGDDVDSVSLSKEMVLFVELLDSPSDTDEEFPTLRGEK